MGGTSLCADVNKNSHFKPVCALTDHSKHYARQDGWTTLGYSTEIILHRAQRCRQSGLRRSSAAGCLPVLCSDICGCYAHSGVMSRQLCRRATTHSFICSRLRERKKGGRKHLLVQADEENKQFQIRFLLEVERASRRVCRQKHLCSTCFLLIFLIVTSIYVSFL